MLCDHIIQTRSKWIRNHSANGIGGFAFYGKEENICQEIIEVIETEERILEEAFLKLKEQKKLFKL